MTTHAATSTLASPESRSFAARAGIFAYGITCYLLGVSGLMALILACLGVLPFTGGVVELSSTGSAIAFNLAFILLFGVQHAIMARPAFKKRWTQIIPEPMERSTFVVLAGGIMGVAIWLWQPLDAVVWSVAPGTAAVAITILGALGWAYMFTASFAIDHFELFGLAQVWRAFRGQEKPQVDFKQRLHYAFDRHPLMTGILFGLWATPNMTLDRFILAAGFTVYIVIGVAIEERTLVQLHGDGYRSYRSQVGALVPLPGKRG